MEQKRLTFNQKATQDLILLFKCEKLDHVKIRQSVLSGADVNVTIDEKNNLSPLMISMMKGQSKLSYFLLCYGASPTHFNSLGQDCLEFAIFAGQCKLMDLLLDLGAKPNRFNGKGETALNLAVKMGNIEMVKSLLRHGADVNMPSLKVKITPLEIAKSRGLREIEKILIGAGAKEKCYNELVM